VSHDPPVPADDHRFTFGLITDVAEVLARHGYPIPEPGSYDTGAVHREIGASLFQLIYIATDLGTQPVSPGRRVEGPEI
jgi:hypothetical protein